MDKDDMGMMDMGDMGDMGDMTVSANVPTPYTIQKTYWAFVGAGIAAATIVNIYEILLCWHRIQAARHQKIAPARPASFMTQSFATMTAIFRELCYISIENLPVRKLGLSLPTLGKFLLACGQLLLVLILCFYRLNPLESRNWESLGMRTGYLAAAQLPLIYILSGKNNIIGYLTGVGYEKINWLHRWAARVLFITVTIHLILWFKNWARYDRILYMLRNDAITQRGFSAWAILLWIVFTSIRPARRLSHDIFIIQHIISMAGLSAAVYMHLPNDMKFVFWISISFAVFDRLFRTANILYQNTKLFTPHPQASRTIGYSASIEQLFGSFTLVTVKNPRFRWTPGQHLFISFPRITPLQSHPFTIVSLPSDKKLTFIIKARNGATRRLFDKAGDRLALDTSKSDAVTIAVEGPYGRVRPLRQFDSVVFVAGGNGATFTVPLMRDLVEKSTAATDKGSAVRHIRFIWAIKSRQHLEWFVEEISNALVKIDRMRGKKIVELSVEIYVSQDDRLQYYGNIDEVSSLDSNAEKRANTIVRERYLQARDNKNDADLIRSRGYGSGVTRDENAQVSDVSTVSSTYNVSSPCSSHKEQLYRGEVHKQAKPLHPAITIIGGSRPETKALLRLTLEQARGESAVIACGPQSLIADVRANVVTLSDERAVHKGTGAQGIYLHTESFNL